ncbi:uncharacterized protein FYW49_017317 [Xenentodon cancila]
MAKIILAIAAVVASFILAESLTCNKCTFSLLGVCLNSNNETCSLNTSVCFTGRATFTSLPAFTGFSTQGCKDNTTGCNATVSGTLLGATFETKTDCCSSDKCNPITISGAPSTKMTLTSAIAASVLGLMSRSIL